MKLDCINKLNNHFDVFAGSKAVGFSEKQEFVKLLEEYHANR